MQEEIYVPIFALNTYSYCPYRTYLEYVLGEWRDNRHTIEGVLKHERAHSGEKRYDPDRIQTTQVFVKSDKYQLVGKIDIVEEQDDQIYPVEYKKGTAGKWLNDHLQLCAQAICLEEQLKVEIESGFLWYFNSRRREEVNFGKDLRKKTLQVTEYVLNILRGKKIPENEYTARCRGCSVKSICLPEETELLRKEGR